MNQDPTPEQIETELYSVADVLNQELRVNGPIEVEQYKAFQLQEGIRKLVDYFRVKIDRLTAAKDREIAELRKEIRDLTSISEPIGAWMAEKHRAERAESRIATQDKEISELREAAGLVHPDGHVYDSDLSKAKSRIASLEAQAEDRLKNCESFTEQMYTDLRTVLDRAEKAEAELKLIKDSSTDESIPFEQRHFPTRQDMRVEIQNLKGALAAMTEDRDEWNNEAQEQKLARLDAERGLSALREPVADEEVRSAMPRSDEKCDTHGDRLSVSHCPYCSWLVLARAFRLRTKERDGLLTQIEYERNEIRVRQTLIDKSRAPVSNDEIQNLLNWIYEDMEAIESEESTDCLTWSGAKKLADAYLAAQASSKKFEALSFDYKGRAIAAEQAREPWRSRALQAEADRDQAVVETKEAEEKLSQYEDRLREVQARLDAAEAKIASYEPIVGMALIQENCICVEIFCEHCQELERLLEQYRATLEKK